MTDKRPYAERSEQIRREILARNPEGLPKIRRTRKKALDFPDGHPRSAYQLFIKEKVWAVLLEQCVPCLVDPPRHRR